MSGLTARLKLFKAAFTDAVNVDTAINNNYDLLDTLVPNTSCTSASRPNAPFDGQKIYETDTGIERIWVALGSGRWAQSNMKYVLSTDARPSNALLGDTLFETDTGITRRWDGTRFRPVGKGNEYFQETAGANFVIAGNAQLGFNIASNFQFSADGNTPYDIELYISGWFANGGSPALDDQMSAVIQYNVNGGAFINLAGKTPLLGTTLLARVSNGVNVDRKGFIFPSGTIQVRPNVTQTQGTNGVVFTQSGAPFLPAYLKVQER